MIGNVPTSTLLADMGLSIAAALRSCGHEVGKVLVDHGPLRLECCEGCGLTITVWVEEFYRTSNPPSLIPVQAGVCTGVEVLEVHFTVSSCYPFYEPGETVPIEDDIREPVAMNLLDVRDCLAAFIDCDDGLSNVAPGMHVAVVKSTMARTEQAAPGEPSCAGWEYVLNVW